MKIMAFRPPPGNIRNFISYILQDSTEALQETGHEVRFISPISDKERFLKIFEEELDRFHPDFFFTIDYYGLSESISLLLNEKEIPYASWFVDKPFYWVSEEMVFPFYVLFVCDRSYTNKAKRLGFSNVFYLPMATNPVRFGSIEPTPKGGEGYSCDISFAGGSFYDSFPIIEGILKGNERAKEITDRVMEIQASSPLLDMEDIFEQVQGVFGYETIFENKMQQQTFYRLLEGASTSLYRKGILEGLNRFSIDLFGDSGWKSLLENKVRFHGEIGYQDQGLLYRGSKINLNMTSVQSKTAINQRVYDISGCGGFLLTDYRSDLANLFEPDEEIICYRDKEDLCKKLEYYLAHPQECSEIARRVQDRVLREHTYLKRMQVLTEIMAKIFNLDP